MNLRALAPAAFAAFLPVTLCALAQDTCREMAPRGRCWPSPKQALAAMAPARERALDPPSGVASDKIPRNYNAKNRADESVLATSARAEVARLRVFVSVKP
jgi:hypothetical protein